MSGIMALMSLDGRPVPEDLARAMLGAVAHRGDREPRLWHTGEVALGHVNFPTTFEAERELLPATDDLGRYWLTWDGRLDNRDELRDKLALDPQEARELTDADYVLRTYRKWGDDCVHHLLGDWAIVIWDAEEHRLFCAKDPLGWRQLYYAEHEGLLAVGSEPQQLFANGWLPRVVNEDYVLRYIGGAIQPEQSTWYERVREIEGGQRVSARSGGTSRWDAYWTAPKPRSLGLKRPMDYVEAFEATFRDAISARLRTNRKVGVYLSGGLDSSYVAAIATQEGGSVTALSSYVPDTKRADERQYFNLVAQHLGVPQRVLDVSDCWTLSSRWLPPECFDMPFHPPQGAHIKRISGVAREEGINVVLGGEGGDEWMNGSELFLADALARGKITTAIQLARVQPGNRPWRREVCRAGFEGLLPFGIQSAARRATGRYRSPQISNSVQSDEGWTPIMAARHRVHYWTPGPFQESDWATYRQTIKLEVSWRDRHECAANLIERRPPFYDLRVVDLMASTPHWVKRFRGRRKDLLREAITHVLPQVIADRQDWGLFTELFEDGLRRHERSRVPLALDAITTLDGIVGPTLRKEVEGYVDGRHRWWQTTSRAVSAGLWLAQERSPRNAVTARTPLVRREDVKV